MMRLATFCVQGQEHYGLVLLHPLTAEDWLFDLHLTSERLQLYASRGTAPYFITRPPQFAQALPPDLAGFLALGDAAMNTLRRMSDFLLRFLEQSDQYIVQGAAWPVQQVELCAPLPRPRLFFGLVQNSPTVWRHNAARWHLNLFPQGHQRPIGTILAPQQPIVLPPMQPIVGGWNPELGVVIGKPGRNIPPEEAMQHVAGLTIVSDVTFDYFRHELFQQPAPYDWFEDAMSSWGDKKSDARTPMGPYLVTLDEIGNPYDLLIYTRQSGFLRDRSHTGAMHLGIERTISWLSSLRTLQAGDVLHMGTMGYDGSVFLEDLPLRAQDYFESEIEKIGVLRNPVVIADEGRDWRLPDDEARRIHPSPAVRQLIRRQETTIQRWQVSDARHFWLNFGNYQTAEVDEGLVARPYPRFLNAPTSALAPSDHTVQLTNQATNLVLDCELACVIGKLTYRVSEAEATDSIWGYAVLAVVHDGALAEKVLEPATPQEREMPKVYARWADGFNIISAPQVVQDVMRRQWILKVDGVGEVRGNTADYRFDAAQIITFISRYITLFPGDVLTLGRTAQRLMLPDDLPAGAGGSAEIAGVGRVQFKFARLEQGQPNGEVSF